MSNGPAGGVGADVVGLGHVIYAGSVPGVNAILHTVRKVRRFVLSGVSQAWTKQLATALPLVETDELVLTP